VLQSNSLPHPTVPNRIGWLCAGLFLVTLATLMLEVLDTRLLSVLTWYHLSFVAVSVAMLGMASGAVLVFVGGELFARERAPALLPGLTIAFALALAVSHAANLVIPVPPLRGSSLPELLALGITTLVLTIPFVISGIVVTLALTRTSAPIGLLYGADLLGAAAGCLAIVWILNRTDITSSALLAAGCAGLAAVCFARFAGRRPLGAGIVTLLLLAAAAANMAAEHPLGIVYPKDPRLWLRSDAIEYSKWNAHSNVTVRAPIESHVYYWGAAENAPATPAVIAHAAIDGAAGTAFTQWDGDPASLAWTRYDVTAVPYQVRQGHSAVIGVGGGRDVLTALAGGSQSVTGIEINEALLDALEGPYRDFARVATHPAVRLVHDEARSYLTRTEDRFDVLQMSLIDTWAATGAGAFTLTENGLYTREAWQVFMRALTPTGVFSVSRWYDPANVSETTRLVSLGVASLLDFGIAVPRDHLLLLTQDRVATLLVSPSPFTPADRARIHALRDEYGFGLGITPWDDPADGQLQRIAAATSQAALRQAAEHEFFDFTAPTDRRPFFFNMLKPAASFLPGNAGAGNIGVVSGNLVATRTLAALGVIAAVLVVTIIIWPLLHVGRPALPPGVFGTAMAYFALIGLGFMFVQIPFLQRFSVYLGHPTYTFSIVLFLMILCAGLGSFASDRIPLERRRTLLLIPALVGLVTLLNAALIQFALEATVAWPLWGRTLVVALFIAPPAFLMGHCFPIGIRLLGRHSDEVTAWMWGVNGACGVMASILAVMLSMWISIDAGLVLAAVLYLLLVIPMKRLAAAR
jgi:SAM-dependent methyltransferase